MSGSQGYMILRRSTFVSTLPIDFGARGRTRSKCNELVDGGEMRPYDEAHIRKVAAEIVRASIEGHEAQLAALGA